MKLNDKNILLSRFVLYILHCLLHFYLFTLRFRLVNEKPWLDHVKQCQGRVILCTWHQQFIAAIRPFSIYYRRFRPFLMISQSRDGEMIATVARWSGWHPVRGSSSKGGKAALREMIKWYETSPVAAHLADGPRGPAGIIKPGLITLAHRADAAVVPFSVSADRAWHLNSWDYFMLPKPFAHVTIRFFEMITLEETRDRDEFEKQRQEIEKKMRTFLICPPAGFRSNRDMRDQRQDKTEENHEDD